MSLPVFRNPDPKDRGFIFLYYPQNSSLTFVIHSFSMNVKSRVFLLLLLLLSPCLAVNVFGQLLGKTKKDTASFPVDSTHFFSFQEDDFSYGNFGRKLELTNSLAGCQDFQPRQSNTGNAGSPEKQLCLPQPSSPTFQRSRGSFSYFGFLAENKVYYESDRPYTKLQFIVGQKQEMNFGVIHAHPFGKNCNVAFGFNRIRSTGFYQRQNTNNTSVSLSGWYRSPGRRYALLSSVFWTEIDVAENGGIANDSDFEFSNQLDRHVVAVNLMAAETGQRFRGASAKQLWSFGKVVDTVSSPNDSIHIKTKISPSWAIVHTVKISDEKYVYNDQNPTSGFYENIFKDTILTNDSTYLWKLENGIGIERFDYSNSTARIFSGKMCAKQEVGEIYNDTIYRHYVNYLVDGSFDLDFRNHFLEKINGRGSYVISGTNQSDYFFQTDLSTGILKFLFQYFISVQTSKQHPQFIFSNYSGNHFRWKNDFYQYEISSICGGLSGKGKKLPMQLSFGYFRFESPIYFGVDQLPQQLNGSVDAFTGNFRLLTGTKLLKIKTDFTWNYLPANSPIRLPEFIVRESVFGDFRVFKNALQLQVGVDATWFSAFYADGYNPAISQFYVQDTKEIGNYVFLDPFVSFKIKPVRIFIKASHINAGMMGRKYYLIPHYPQNDFALKFGLTWVFND